jgi:hypothetical protein
MVCVAVTPLRGHFLCDIPGIEGIEKSWVVSEGIRR